LVEELAGSELVWLELVGQSQVGLPQAVSAEVQQSQEQRFQALQSQAQSVAVQLRVEAVLPFPVSLSVLAL
jgi:hypothetical protein